MTSVWLWRFNVALAPVILVPWSLAMASLPPKGADSKPADRVSISPTPAEVARSHSGSSSMHQPTQPAISASCWAANRHEPPEPTWSRSATFAGPWPRLPAASPTTRPTPSRRPPSRCSTTQPQTRRSESSSPATAVRRCCRGRRVRRVPALHETRSTYSPRRSEIASGSARRTTVGCCSSTPHDPGSAAGAR